MEAVENQIVVYQPNETVRMDVRLENETVWLTQAQLCALFQRDVPVISRHIKNIFAEGELAKESNLHFLQIANADRPVAFYSGRGVKIELVTHSNGELAESDFEAFGKQCGKFTKTICGICHDRELEAA